MTDDSSTDQTAAICRDWLNKNGSFFVRAQLLTSEKNQGIVANTNKGLKEAQGEWIKDIAGDDSLKANCIESNLAFIARNPEAEFIHTAVDYYSDEISDEHFLKCSNDRYGPLNNNYLDINSQFHILLTQPHINASSVMIRRELIERAGYYDESIPMLEDWPMWFKLSSMGIRLYFSDASTVNYRFHAASESRGKSSGYYHRHRFQIYQVYTKYLLPYLSPFHRFIIRYIISATHFAYNFFNNKRNIFSRGFHFLFIKPFENIHESLNNKIITKYDRDPQK